MSNQQFQSPYRPNVSEIPDLTIWGKNKANPQGKSPSWRIRIAGNKARINVYPQVDGDNKKIEGILSPVVFFRFLEMMKHVAKAPANGPMKVTYMIKRNIGQGKIVPDYELYTGRNDEGICYVSIIRHDRPKIQFFFEEDRYQELRHHSGEQLSKGEASTIMFKGYIATMEALAGPLFVQEFVESDRDASKQQNRQGGYNGGNRGNGGNGGNNYQNNGGYDNSGGSSSGDDWDDVQY